MECKDKTPRKRKKIDFKVEGNDSNIVESCEAASENYLMENVPKLEPGLLDVVYNRPVPKSYVLKKKRGYDDPEVKLRSRQNRKSEVENKKVRDEIKELHHQCLRRSMKINQTRIENWPEGINQFKKYWSLEEIEAIRSVMHTFKFHSDPTLLDKVVQLPKEAITDLSISKDDARAEMLERFKTETGYTNALMIDWNQVDVSKIPARYEITKINAKSFSNQHIYCNSDIFRNIHFLRYSDGVLHHKQNKQPGYRALLDLYRQQVDPGAVMIRWHSATVTGLEGIDVDILSDSIDREIMRRLELGQVCFTPLK